MVGESGTSKTGAIHCYYTCANKNASKPAKRKMKIFVSAVYLYDDRLYITYNLTNEKSDLERPDLLELTSHVAHAVSGSDMVCYGGGDP
jgi:hypothetical protein